MKTAIVYYSMGGNTAYAAEKIKNGLGENADIIEISPQKAYPDKGFKKFFWGGKSAVMAETPALVPYSFNADSYDCVIIGFPVWASNIAPPLRTFIKENELSGKKIAAFACQSGSGAEKAFEKLCKCLEIEKLIADMVLIDPKSKPDEGNDRKIQEFCDKLKDGLNGGPQ